MEVEPDRVQRALRKLSESMKRVPRNPPPEEVHKLRNEARRVESIATALLPSGNKTTRRLLKSIKPILKAAGNVRDMDVLTNRAMTLPQKPDDDSLVRLIEHLGEKRLRRAGELVDIVDRKRKAARQSLKEYSKLVESAFAEKTDAASSAAREQHVYAVTSVLATKLAQWKTLSARNIHSFRLKVKELRCILQLLPDSDPRLLKALRGAKDQIGDWHDWQQLAEIAGTILGARKHRPLFSQINTIVEEKLTQALAASNSLRTRRLGANRSAPSQRARTRLPHQR